MAARGLLEKTAVEEAVEALYRVMTPKSGPTFCYRAIPDSAHDGDTIRFNIDLGMSTWKMREPVRLLGVNTPEVNRRDSRVAGLAVRDYVRALLGIDGEGRTPVEVDLWTVKDKGGKYPRLLGVVVLPDGQVLNEVLLEGGYGAPFVV